MKRGGLTFTPALIQKLQRRPVDAPFLRAGDFLNSEDLRRGRAADRRRRLSTLCASVFVLAVSAWLTVVFIDALTDGAL